MELSVVFGFFLGLWAAVSLHRLAARPAPAPILRGQRQKQKDFSLAAKARADLHAAVDAAFEKAPTATSYPDLEDVINQVTDDLADAIGRRAVSSRAIYSQVHACVMDRLAVLRAAREQAIIQAEAKKQ